MDASSTLSALQYFGLPMELWPFGLKVKHDVLSEVETQLQSHFPVAKGLLDHMCTSIAGMATAELAKQGLRYGRLFFATSCEEVLKDADFGAVFEVERFDYPTAEPFHRTHPCD